MPANDYYLPKRRLVSQEDASIIESPNVPRSKFTNQWSRKTTFDAGYLVPFLVDEILPGDHMNYNISAYVRMSTPLFPLFDSQRIDTFFFFVPNRLTWENWIYFMGEQDNPGDPIDTFVFPQMPGNNGGYQVGTIYDHMGLPTDGQITGVNNVDHSSLPLRAYNQIWNQWFRDENLQNSAPINKGDGADAVGDYTLRRRAKSHDYFTSALPWPQKFTAPTVPLGGSAPVLGIGSVFGGAAAGPLANVRESDGNLQSYANYKELWGAGGDPHEVVARWTDPVDGYPDIYADLSVATGVAINTFRQAFLVQTLLERDARGGTRYVELIRSHFKVTNPDFRLQRPEYIGGGQTPLNVTPIAQTAPGDDGTVGELGAAATAAGQHTASYAATEHGFIIGLINVRTELSYQQGQHRMWNRITRYDYYWPALAQLGEQAILRKEIYALGTAQDEEVFGYQERHAEYRQRYSEVTGLFKSTSTGNIDEWHLAQQFSASPTLGDTFIQDTPPMARVLAAGDLAVGQQYIADINIRRTAVRPLPMFGTPAILGRF